MGIDYKLEKEFERLHGKYGDLYEVLGLQKDSTAKDVLKAFRKNALEFHPDRNKTQGAEEKFKGINAAYAILDNPEQRHQYDEWLAMAGGQHAEGQTAGQAAGKTENPAYNAPPWQDAWQRAWQNAERNAESLERLVQACVNKEMSVHDFMAKLRGFNLSPQQHDLVDRLLENYFEEKRQKETKADEEEAAQVKETIERMEAARVAAIKKAYSRARS